MRACNSSSVTVSRVSRILDCDARGLCQRSVPRRRHRHVDGRHDHRGGHLGPRSEARRSEGNRHDSGGGTDDGPVTGIISGNTIRLRYDDGREMTPSLNVKGDRIEGVLSGGSQVILRRTSK